MKRPDLFAPLPVGLPRHPKTARARAQHPKAFEAFVVLIAAEYEQHSHGGPSGDVKLTPADFCLRADIVADDDLPGLTAILGALASVGWVEVVTLDQFELHVRLVNAGEWRPSDPTNAERQARHRARLKEAAAAVERDVTDPVTPRNAEEKREEEKEYAPEVRRLSQLLADLLRARDDKARVGPDTKAWLDPVRLLLDRDGRSAEDVERVIRWAQGDAFWQNTVRSTSNLRKHFDRLFAAAGLARPVTARGLSALDEALGGA